MEPASVKEPRAAAGTEEKYPSPCVRMALQPGVAGHGAWPYFGVGLPFEQKVKQVAFFAEEENSSAAEEPHLVQKLGHL